MDKRLQQLREEYKSVQIPKELDIIVEKALQQEPKRKESSCGRHQRLSRRLFYSLHLSTSAQTRSSDVKNPCHRQDCQGHHFY